MAGNTQERKLGYSIEEYPEGIVLAVDKPWRWTSADVIRKVKFAAFRHFGTKHLKVGHAGTLDPLATGVLLICIGKATKRAQELQDHDKEYVADIAFGATTPSYDLEKEVDRLYPYEHITREAVEAVLPSFLGEQEQVAPLFSAKSVDGVRAYEMARKMYKAMKRGETSSDFDAAAIETLQKARIRIDELELVDFFPSGKRIPEARGEISGASSRINVADTSALDLPVARVRIVCSKGTYIRAFARDLGEVLGSGAHLAALRRTRSGEYSVADALSLTDALSLLAPPQ